MIVNFLWEKISVEKKKEIVGNIEVKNNAKILELTEQPIDALGTKQAALNIKFSFIVAYEPTIATIALEGRIIDIMDDKERKEVLTLWKKEQKIDPKISSRWMNLILAKGNVKALSLGNEVNLPSHIPFPRLAKKAQIEKKK